jgi:hypothetical protein
MLADFWRNALAPIADKTQIATPPGTLPATFSSSAVTWKQYEDRLKTMIRQAR